jgi:N6-adenosine-specific RNA methylase IME4
VRAWASPFRGKLCGIGAGRARAAARCGREVGFYVRNVTEVLLFGTRGRNARTLPPGRRQVNMLQSRRREHSGKPDEQYALIESCSWGPILEFFGRGVRDGWTVRGNRAEADCRPTWKTYAYNSAVAAE